MAEIQNIRLVVVILWVFQTFVLAEKQHSCVFSKDDSFKKYTCVGMLAGTMSLVECSFRCCSQNRCIGVFHDQISSVCMLINGTEKKEVCDILNWSTWRAYKKQIELGECNGYLMSTIGYSRLGLCSIFEIDENCRLFYAPSGSNEIGGGNVDLIPEESSKCLLVILTKPVTVRGVATQGKWRNESLDTCCDERVTSYTIHYSVDCEIAWTFIWVDNYKMFEANVIPDAGNEVIINLFEQPVFGKCFAFYPMSSYGQPIARWDLIGCDN